MGSSLIDADSSSSRTIQTSSPSCATLSACMSIRPLTPSCCRSTIQALDRTQPGPPLKRGRLGTMTHDYRRHGTMTLFAALNVLDGTMIGRNMQRHRHQEFIRFLNIIESEVPVGKIIHVILDNYAAHTHPNVRAWLDRRPRFVFHFALTSCSRLNAVEGFFAKLSRGRLKRAVVRRPQAAINRCVAETNADPKPFTWTANRKKIIAAVKRGHQSVRFHPLGIRYVRDVLKVEVITKRYPPAAVYNGEAPGCQRAATGHVDTVAAYMMLAPASGTDVASIALAPRERGRIPHQWPDARRVFERDLVHVADVGPSGAGRLAMRIQPCVASFAHRLAGARGLHRKLLAANRPRRCATASDTISSCAIRDDMSVYVHPNNCGSSVIASVASWCDLKSCCTRFSKGCDFHLRAGIF
ncbi:DDE superfamily endonuclease [Bradyrhizobium sp. OK095]|nr:DDE superfamily endonuclease [Bradyrhizobium sp. OK095]